METVTVTITAERAATETGAYELGWTTTTAVCTVCGAEPKTVTITVPCVTSTVTFVATAESVPLPSASGFVPVPVNSTEVGGVPSYSAPPLEAREAREESAAGRVGGRWLVVVGVVVAVLIV